jgi:hypothetical protein
MKLDLTKFRDLDTVLTLPMRQRVDKIGLELEGAWIKLPKGCRSLVNDSSVKIPKKPITPKEQELAVYIKAHTNMYSGLYDGLPPALVDYQKLYEERNAKDWQFSGEMVSQPLGVEEVENWMRQSYPSHVNETCGLHVHMSFKTKMNYQRLMAPEFSSTVIEYLSRWARVNLPANHPIWERLITKESVQNTPQEFCQHLFFADDQSKWTRKEYEHFAKTHRYTVMNYCFLRHSTVECRILPMFDTVDLAWSAVQELIKITNAFLVTTREIKEERLSLSVLANESEIATKTEVWI